MWLKNGSCFTWGDGIDGKLGHPIDFDSGRGFEKMVPYPKYVRGLENCFAI